MLVEWTDTNLRNVTFEGTAREVMRVQLNHRIHPMGELVFHPTARRGDPEWRVMYIGIGDGGAGELRTIARPNPQRLDTLVGKIVRIIPDPAEHVATSTLSENGRYRIPNDNPFASKPGVKKEIWAYGLRNPHRLSWAADPAESRRHHLIAAVVGLRTWEMVSIIRKGANYGYSQREGNQLLQPDNVIAPLPAVDKIAVQIGDEVTDEVVVPTYPVVQYGHVPTGGDGIGSGYVYTGKALPALRGKYIFSDLSTGRVWYSDWKEMLAADDGDPKTLAQMHEVKLRWNDQVHDTFTSIAQTAYQSRGGKDPDLPGRGTVSGSRRADARFALDAAGELFVYSKTDGMIRQVVSARDVGSVEQDPACVRRAGPVLWTRQGDSMRKLFVPALALLVLTYAMLAQAQRGGGPPDDAARTGVGCPHIDSKRSPKGLYYATATGSVDDRQQRRRHRE